MNRIANVFAVATLSLASAFSVVHAEEQKVAKADAARGETIFNNGVPANGVPACTSCHGAGGNSAMNVNPKLAGQHAEYVEKISPYGKHLFIEKPFADSLAAADQMNAALAPGKQLIINWPLRWYPSHATAFRLISQGLIGSVREVHYYDGNRGPLAHGADKIAKDVTPELKAESWFYKKSGGGGALLDYLGYGTTLGAWFNGGKSPVDVTTVTGGDPNLEVDEHSITICRYADGTLSKFETKWGTFTDPWTHQPQPKCGFNIVGSEGTIASYDLEPTIHVQTQSKPEGETIACDDLVHPFHAPIPYVLNRIENGLEIDGPLSPKIARIGQQIVDAAVLSATTRTTVSLKNL